MSREMWSGEVISGTHGFTDIETTLNLVLLCYSPFITLVGIELTIWRPWNHD